MGTFWEHLPKKKKPKHLIYRYLDFFLVPRPAFEITKSGTIRLNRKTMKFKLN